jgi:adenosylmethionine-8-amino-7-oxononanoate aminotransferase
MPCTVYEQVKDVRVIGAIGVIELHRQVDINKIQPLFVEMGVWIRPFNNLIYIMPPYIINTDDLEKLTHTIVKIVASIEVTK